MNTTATQAARRIEADIAFQIREHIRNANPLDEASFAGEVGVLLTCADADVCRRLLCEHVANAHNGGA